jgi:hypothetical protein
MTTAALLLLTLGASCDGCLGLGGSWTLGCIFCQPDLGGGAPGCAPGGDCPGVGEECLSATESCSCGDNRHWSCVAVKPPDEDDLAQPVADDLAPPVENDLAAPLDADHD